MARNDDSQRDAGAPSRVYKSSDVHKRRVDRKGRPKGRMQLPEIDAPSAAAEGRSAERPESVEPARSTRPAEPAAPAGREASGREASERAPEKAPEKAAVVIAPEFGKRTQAQREADERWFAAMRENDDPAGRRVEQGGSQAAAGLLTLPEIEAPAAQREGAAPDVPGVPDTPDALGELPVQAPTAPDRQDEPAPQQPDVQPAQADVQPAQPDETSQPDGSTRPSAAAKPSVRRSAVAPPRSPKRIAALVITVIVVVALAGAVAFFTWNRWYRFDDHADMQGEWYVVGTTVPVTIDADKIVLTKDVTYSYEIDAQDKTIRYTFGPMAGQGRYWFSDDRKYLVITDGDEFTSTGTAVEDLLHTFSDLTSRASGNDIVLPEGEGIIAFSREPDAEAKAREEAEAKAKAEAEEAARKEAERQAAEEAAREAAEYEEYYEEESGE